VDVDLTNLLAALRDDPTTVWRTSPWPIGARSSPTPPFQARGEHVRLSLALAKLSRNDQAGREMRNRVRSLEKRHRAAWLGPLLALAHRCDFLPGGLVKVEVTAADRGRPVRRSVVRLARRNSRGFPA